MDPIERAVQRRKERKIHARIMAVTLILAVVVFCSVLWLLRKTGEAMTNPPGCGMQEHVHSPECYRQNLICTLPEGEGHIHSPEAGCYTEVSQLTCGIEEQEPHTHSLEAGCYEKQKTLICTLEECESHTHTDACYTTEKQLACQQAEGEMTAEGQLRSHSEECYAEKPVLSCTLPEGEGHTHTAECYAEQDVLICQLPEAGHTHTEACYHVELVLTCKEPEAEAHTHGENCWALGELVCSEDGHTHTKECYATRELNCAEEHTHLDACYREQAICGIQAHSHTEACFPDLKTDVEDASEWGASVPERTGVWRTDLVNTARSQLGYRESSQNYILDETGSKQGYTRYGAWYGNPYGEWNAMFVSFCLNYGGIPQESFPRSAGAWSWAARLQELGMYYASGEYTPLQGDIAFLTNERVGIVESVGNTVSMIEGDIDGAVGRREYALGSSEIAGYAALTASHQSEEGTAEGALAANEGEEQGEETLAQTESTSPEESLSAQDAESKPEEETAALMALREDTDSESVGSYTLPATGGIGNGVLYCTGAALLLAAAWHFRKRKRENSA